MDFTLSPEHLMVQKMVRDFAQKEVQPTIKEWDRMQQMNPETLPRMAELGILGICLPVKYGGQGFDYISLGLVCEELEAVDTSLRVVMSVHMGLEQPRRVAMGHGRTKAALPRAAGQGREIRDVRPDRTRRRQRCGEHGFDRAQRDGSDYIINGEKMWISLATKAHHILWFAKTDPNAKDPHEGITAFMIDTSMKGVTTRRSARQTRRARRIDGLGELQRGARAAGKSHRRRRRGLQDRDVGAG